MVQCQKDQNSENEEMNMLEQNVITESHRNFCRVDLKGVATAASSCLVLCSR